MDPFSLVLILFVILGLAAEHYFPYWIFITGRKLPSPVRLVVNYAAGTLVWFGAFTVWLVVKGLYQIALVGWGFVLVAGLTVISLYAYDNYITKSNAANDRRQVLEVMERRRDATKKGTD